MSRLASKVFVALLFGFIGGLIGWYLHATLPDFLANNPDLLTPLSAKPTPTEPPLAKYYFDQLAQQEFTATAPLEIKSELSKSTGFTSFLFTYVSQGKTISGQLNIPDTPAPPSGYPAIVMLRGYVPLEIYQTGVGTKNAAAVFAEQGFVTIAPDFLGFGESEPDLTDTWESRFIKPVQIAELLATITKFPSIQITTTNAQQINPSKLGLWAHSNGGQIALATLAITGQPLPTTLWAPVTAPFPYSVLFFSDELADEGKEQRAWIALFEKEYNAQRFSLTKNLNLLPATSIQIHHGVTDDAALIAWSDEFVQKVELENKNRATFSAELIATAAAKYQLRMKPIAIKLFRYPNTDHNMQPSWNTVVERDLTFFKKELQ